LHRQQAKYTQNAQIDGAKANIQKVVSYRTVCSVEKPINLTSLQRSPQQRSVQIDGCFGLYIVIINDKHMRIRIRFF
jgi:hypothetical protein